MKVLVCGGRDYDDRDKVFSVLDGLKEKYGIDYVIEGGAKGADSIAKEWRQERGIIGATFKADWNKWGKRAGVIRNTSMLFAGNPDYVIAFPGGRGTENMLEQSVENGFTLVNKATWRQDGYKFLIKARASSATMTISMSTE